VHEVAVAREIFGQGFEELLHRVTQKGLGVTGIHPVTVKLDEDPVRTTLDADCGLAPKPQAVHGGRARACQLAVFDAW
jgi:hypothetical protein